MTRKKKANPSLNDDASPSGNRDDQVPSPIRRMDEVVPGGTVNRGDGEANSRGPNPSGTRRGNSESVVTPPSPFTFKPGRNFDSPDPPESTDADMRPPVTPYRMHLQDESDQRHAMETANPVLAHHHDQDLTSSVTSEVYDIILDPIVSHLVSKVLKIEQTSPQFLFLEQNGYLRDVTSLTDFPISSTMEDTYLPMDRNGFIQGDPQYLIRGIALELQKFRLWCDHILSSTKIGVTSIGWISIRVIFKILKLNLETILILTVELR